MQKFLFAVVITILLSACNRNEKTDRLTFQIDSVWQEINTYQDSVDEIKATISLLQKDKEIQLSECKALKDTLNAFIDMHSIANACSKRLSQSPEKILEEYIMAKNDDERAQMLVRDLFHVGYYNWENNAFIVNAVEQQLQVFDIRLVDCSQRFDSICRQISTYQQTADSYDAKIASLQDLKSDLENQKKEYE